MRDQFSRPIPRRLRLGAFYALSGVALVLSVVGLVFFGSVLLWLGPFALRFLPFFLHPTNDPYGISGLVWVMELVALVLSAALTVGFLYLLFVVVVSVVMLLRQLLLSIPRGTSAAATTRVVSVLRRIARSALGPVPPRQPQHQRVVSIARRRRTMLATRDTPATSRKPSTPRHPGVSPSGDGL